MTFKPITYMSFNLGSDADVDSQLLVGIRVIPTSRDGSTVFARTLNYGELDSGEGIVLQPGERLLFPPGSVKATIQDIDWGNTPDSDGYAVIANTVWTWLQIGPSPDQSFFNYLFAAARRLDSAHALCVSTIREFDNPPDELFIKSRARIFRALSSGPHHQDSGEAKIRESTAGVSRKPSSDCKACGCSSKHLCGLTAWNT